MPSTFFDPSFSLRRLRTTPARNPRTECCCQPVAFIIAAIVAPAGDCSIAMTRDCFEPGSALCGRAGLAFASGDRFAAVVSVCAGRGNRFFADLDIEILRFGWWRRRAAPPKPHLGDLAGGAGPRSAHALGIDDSTAPIAPECQSFLDNVIAQFDGVLSMEWSTRPNLSRPLAS